MPAARLIVCERTSRWATSLRSALRMSAARKVPEISETRSLTQAEVAWRASPGAALALEITAANLGAAVDLLVRLSREPQTCLLALLDPELAAAETVLREAGATAVVPSMRAADSAARLIYRHLDAISTVPLTRPRAADLREAIAARLPWPRQASAPA